jgi:Flp pilus assembly protein TadG
MKSSIGRRRLPGGQQRGQILVLTALSLVALMAAIGLLLDGGNAYAQQRGVQNAADAAANAGADVLAQRLGGLATTDADVSAAVSTISGLNATTAAAYYTNVSGQPIDLSGNVVSASQAAPVGNPSNTIPPNARGVHASGSRTFGTSFARVIGLNNLTAGADAIAITGPLVGGQFLPVVFPVNITDCSGNGSLGAGETEWITSAPGTPPAHPVGQEYIIPLCKTGGGSFMVLDFDPSMTCAEEVIDPPAVQFTTFPTLVDSDNGNNCAKPIADAVNANLHYHTILVPICDQSCVTAGGSHAQYNIIGIRGFFIDHMYDESNPNKISSECQAHNNADGQSMIPIAGNGSSSCLTGWFVTPIQTGTVGTGTINPGDAIAIQLIK